MNDEKEIWVSMYVMLGWSLFTFMFPMWFNIYNIFYDDLVLGLFILFNIITSIIIFVVTYYLMKLFLSKKHKLGRYN